MNIFNHKTIAGFSLVEMMVSIGVIVIITTVVLYNNRRFNDSITLSTAAYGAALAVRESQVYGLSVRINPDNSFDYAYGVHFDLNSSSQYMSFIDSNDNKIYGGGSELITTLSYGEGITVYDICVIRNDATENCNPTYIDVTFKRPKPEANIYAQGIGLNNSNVQGFRIKLQSPRGLMRTIEVYRTGQISTGS